MLRGDNIVCGTSTTGTGTLTLAASPGPPGGIDFDVFARATGIGMANSAAVLVTYTIIEYTSSAFTTMKSHEKGVGTLTLGGSSGIANCTLARTTVQTTATSLNSQPATQNIGGAAFSIATAANTLIFIGASAVDVPAFSPYFDTSVAPNNDGNGVPMPGTNGSTRSLRHNNFFYGNFVWLVPMLAKRATINVSTAYTGGTTNAWVRLYDIKSNGVPGKILYDFGQVGTLNSGLNATGNVSTGAAGNGFMMMPGDYWLCLAVSFSGGSGTPAIRLNNQINPGRLGSLISISNSMAPAPSFYATGTASATPDDPAVLTGGSVEGDGCPGVCFKDS